MQCSKNKVFTLPFKPKMSFSLLFFFRYGALLALVEEWLTKKREKKLKTTNGEKKMSCNYVICFFILFLSLLHHTLRQKPRDSSLLPLLSVTFRRKRGRGGRLGGLEQSRIKIYMIDLMPVFPFSTIGQPSLLEKSLLMPKVPKYLQPFFISLEYESKSNLSPCVRVPLSHWLLFPLYFFCTLFIHYSCRQWRCWVPCCIAAKLIVHWMKAGLWLAHWSLSAFLFNLVLLS